MMAYLLKRLIGVALVLVVVGGSSLGQEKSNESTQKAQSGKATYKLDFVLSEVQDGKRINARNYSALVREGEWAKIRLGDRVPLMTGGSSLPGGAAGPAQFQYIDVGTNIDTRVATEVESGLPISVTAEVSSIVPEQQGEKFPAPLVRQLRYSLDAVIPMGKQTVLSSADELVGNRHLQIEVTATKVR
jgi:hypothetical protein